MPDPSPDFSTPRDAESPWKATATAIFDQLDVITATARIAIDPGVTGPSSG